MIQWLGGLQIHVAAIKPLVFLVPFKLTGHLPGPSTYLTGPAVHSVKGYLPPLAPTKRRVSLSALSGVTKQTRLGLTRYDADSRAPVVSSVGRPARCSRVWKMNDWM